MNKRYLKVWDGHVTGSFMGRDDGHPKEQIVIYDSIDRVARNYGLHTNEKYYTLGEVNYKELEEEVSRVLERDAKEAKKAESAKIANEIKRLQKQLDNMGE